ncbi:MAG: DUF6268 family outer membrane beta-barrel protein [Planctomycetota bacterium]
MLSTRFFVATASVALAAPLALAQGAEPPADSGQSGPADAGIARTPPGQTPRETLWGDWTFTLTVDGSHHLQADLDDEGDLAVSRVASAIGVGGRIGNQVDAQLTFASEFSFYDFDGATSFDADGDPFDTTYQYDINGFLRGQIDPRWGWFAGGGVTWAGEAGASASQNLRGRGFGGVTYAVSDNLRVGLGVGAFSRLEDSTLIVPIPTLRWQIDERSSLATGGEGGIGGLGVRYTYRPNEQWALFAQGRFVGREYRLDDDGPIPEGVARDDRIELSVGANYNATPNLSLNARVGFDVFSEIEIDDRSGNQIAEEDLDPSLVFGLGLRVRF